MNVSVCIILLLQLDANNSDTAIVVNTSAAPTVWGAYYGYTVYSVCARISACVCACEGCYFSIVL